ncbi:apolipoprotein N-acyltransferase [candidate division KSB1 bacterium]|nr:MAG: apolipoprotein N-acyltransferase [candidate division KSB1 bacterium]
MKVLWKNIALSLLTALLLTFAFPPYQLGFLAYWGLVPFFYLLKNKTIKDALKWGYITGLFFNLMSLYWIAWTTIPGTLAAILVLAFYFAFYAWTHVQLQKKLGKNFIFLLPFLWVSIEYVRSLGVLGFPWNSLAYTQSYYLSLIQYVSFTGVYGVSFWVVWINVVLFHILENKRSFRTLIWSLLLLIFLFFLPWVYGKLTIPPADEFQEKIQAALIQGNVDPLRKWDEAFLAENFDIYERLTRKAANYKPDLIVWPETATACFLRCEPEYSIRIRHLVDSLKTPLLTGSPDYEFVTRTEYETYNAIFLFLPFCSQIQRYFKIHLVPFGERVPFEDVIPFLNKFLESLNMGVGDFSPGKKLVLFHMPYPKSKVETDCTGSSGDRLLFAGVVCFESIFPGLVRKFINRGARFLVIVTNDAWFGTTSELAHHAQIAVFRAIENRIGVARCANTGISMFIDPYGRVSKKTQINTEAYIVGDVPLRTEKTFYTQHGDVFTYAILLVTIVGVIKAYAQRNQKT